MTRDQWKTKMKLKRADIYTNFRVNGEDILYSEIESIGPSIISTDKSKNTVKSYFKIYMKSGRVIESSKTIKPKFKTVKNLFFGKKKVFENEPSEYFDDVVSEEHEALKEKLVRCFQKYNTKMPTLKMY